MLWNAHDAARCRSTRCTTRSSRRGPRGRWRSVVLVCAALGRLWLLPARAARVVRAGGRVRSVPGLRPRSFRRPSRAATRCRWWCRWRIWPWRGCACCRYDTGLAVAVAIAMFDAHVGGTSIAAFARQKAPAFRLLDEMRRRGGDRRPSAAGAGHGPAAGSRLPPADRLGGRCDARDRAQAAGAAEARVAGGGEVLEQRRPRAGLVRRRSDADQHRPGPARRAAALPLAAAVSGAGRAARVRTRWIGTSSIGRSGTSAKGGR